MLKTDMGKIRTVYFVFKKMGRMFFCQVLRSKPEGEKDTMCFQLCIWLNSLCFCYHPQKVQKFRMYRLKCDSKYVLGSPNIAKCHFVYEVKIRLLHVQALNISPMASNVQITANTLVLELGLQHNLYPAVYHWKTFIWNTSIEQNLHFQGSK